MAAVDERWIETGFTENLGDGRDVHDALLELFMNAVDAEQDFATTAAGEFQMPTIEATPAGAVVITNRSVAGIDKTHFYIGRPSNVKDDPKKMGRYSMGLKDAIAILTRHKCRIELTAHGRLVEFAVAQDTGLILYRFSPREGGGKQWRLKIDNVPDTQSAVADVKGHFIDFFEPALELFHTERDHSGTLIHIYTSNSLSKKKVPCFRGPKNTGGLFVGRRFVKFPHNSVLTNFGYHFPEPTAAIKKLIDRNQTLSSVREEVIFNSLLDVFKNDELVAKVVNLLPNGPVHELSGLIPKERWPPRAGAVSGAAGPPRVGLNARPAAGAARTPRVAEKPLPAVKLEAEAAAAPPRLFSFSGAHVKDVVESTKKQIRSTWKEHGVAVLNELNDLAREAFPEASAQVVPYGSIVYEVATPRSDVDVTLMIFPSVKPGTALEIFEATLQGKGMNVDASALKAPVPVLKVQKDTKAGVPFHVDISVNNHSAVHKSHALRDLLLKEYPGADDLALLVKLWAAKWGFTGPPFLSSHGWMLVVARFCAEVAGSASDYNEAAFFAWFQKAFPPREPWVLGMRAPPFEDEEDNPAARVDKATREQIVAAADLAERNLRDKRVPWAAADPSAAGAAAGAPEHDDAASAARNASPSPDAGAGGSGLSSIGD